MGFWGSLGKGLLKAAPIAASFIPGVGPIAGMAIGAATGAARGAMGGGGLKGAIGGGIQGAADAKAAKGLGPSMSTAGKIGEIGKSAVGGMGSSGQQSSGGYGQTPAYPGQTPGINGGYPGGGRGGFQQQPSMGGRRYNQNNPFIGGMNTSYMQRMMQRQGGMQQNPYMQQGDNVQYGGGGGGGMGSQGKGGPWSRYTGEDVGHEGTTKGGMNRQQYRDAWMSSGISNPAQMNEWLQSHGGQMLNESGVVRTPFGETLDMGIAYKTGKGQPGWTDIGMNEQSPDQGWAQPQQQQQQQPYQDDGRRYIQDPNRYQQGGIGPSYQPEQPPPQMMEQQQEEPRQKWGRARF